MSYATALAEAKRLKSIMERWGVPCSIELVAGRGSDPWSTPKKYHRMHHHTVSTWRSSGNLTPVLSLCKTGRSDVPGPLCNGYGGYDGAYRVICMGLANHPGAGGPITIDGVHIPRDSARGPTWGTEWEGGLQDYEDIKIPRYRGGMLEFMGRADCALAEFTGRPITSQMEHKTWAPTRKIDRRGFDRARGIALSRQYAGGGSVPPEDDMPSEDQIIDRMAIRLQAGNDPFRRAMAKLVYDETAKFDDPAPTQPILIRGTDEGGWTGGVYVFAADRGHRWEVRGWDSVAALVAFYNVAANGTGTNGFPQPWPMPVALLNQIPLSKAPEVEAPSEPKPEDPPPPPPPPA